MCGRLQVLAVEIIEEPFRFFDMSEPSFRAFHG